MTFGQTLDQADLWSDVTPTPPYAPVSPLDAPPLVQTSSGQEWYYLRSA